MFNALNERERRGSKFGIRLRRKGRRWISLHVGKDLCPFAIELRGIVHRHRHVDTELHIAIACDQASNSVSFTQLRERVQGKCVRLLQHVEETRVAAFSDLGALAADLVIEL